MVKHIHVPIPNQRSESATSRVIEEGAVRTALTRDPHVLGKKSGGKPGPSRDLSAEKFDLFVPALD